MSTGLYNKHAESYTMLGREEKGATIATIPTLTLYPDFVEPTVKATYCILCHLLIRVRIIIALKKVHILEGALYYQY